MARYLRSDEKTITLAYTFRLRERFRTDAAAYLNRNGQKFEVLGPVTEGAGEHVRVRFEDGESLPAYLDEVAHVRRRNHTAQ